MRRFLIAILAALLAWIPVGNAQLRGHGGPVRSLAIAADGKSLISGSFDQSAIVWSLEREAATQVLQFHEGAVNAVAMLRDGRLVTAGEDGRIAVWTRGREHPDAVLEGHAGPVVALAVSPDGSRLASAAWDGTVRLWALRGGAPVVLEGHRQNVNGVAFLPDGRVVSAGYDATVRIWPLPPGAPMVRPLTGPVNAVAVAPDGEIIAGTADGHLHFLSPAAAPETDMEAQSTPITSIAVSPDGKLVAAAGMRGSVGLIEPKTRAPTLMLNGEALPVWAVAFSPGNVFTGGGDRLIRWWDAATGVPFGRVALGRPEDPLAAFGNDPGARVFRACAACHSLQPETEHRAGPTLSRIFGRHIASVPGYPYSDAFRRLDIVWTRETVAKLFELGPAQFTPGTKMPEQRIRSPQDRAALVDFLERATRAR